MSGIYFIDENDELTPMAEERYESEEVLQAMLARHPELLAGDQIDDASPRRWLLISREQPVPAEEAGAGRWALDHLFVDQDGIPTLVEVKRSSDTRLRREVVGQMLDYAANGIVYWPADAIRARFEARCASDGGDAERVLEDALGVADGEAFWRAVKANLEGGRVRLVFVADLIPPELRRVVEFLNGQMAPAEVLAVEIQQFVGRGLRTLVPRVIGQTAQAEVRKARKEAARVWTRDLFMQRVGEQLPVARAAAIEQVLAACEGIADDMGYGRGRAASISPKFLRASAKSFFTIREDGRLWINLGWHDQPEAGADAPRYRDDFLRRLRAKGFRIADAPYPGLPADEWIDKAPELIRVVRQLFASSA